MVRPMKAITFQDIETLALEEVAEPTLESPGDVIVRVEAAGICGSDLHVYHGREAGLDAGTIMGHEFVGEVVEVGPAVDTWSPGDRVLSPFTTNCGRCEYCVEGLTSRCIEGQLFGWVEGGRGLHGCQADFVRVPLADSTLVRVPEGLSREASLFAGDILSTGFFGAETAGAAPGRTVAVVGCGPVGQMAILAARHLGADEVVALDRVPERLELAQRFGADLTASDPGELGGKRIDAVVEAVGSPGATGAAFDLVRPGGVISAVGVHTEEHFAFSPGDAYDKNLTYRAGRCPVRHYLDRVLEVAADHDSLLRSLVSHPMSLDEGVRGYDLFARRVDGCTKVVLISGS